MVLVVQGSTPQVIPCSKGWRGKQERQGRGCGLILPLFHRGYIGKLVRGKESSPNVISWAESEEF